MTGKAFAIQLFLFLSTGLLGQERPADFFARNYLFQERLAKGLVFDIIQDKYGFMWLGTEYGLLRYDGCRMETFQYEPSNPYSLAGNVITALAEDPLGNLWVGTMYSGLHYFDRTTRRFTRYQYDPEDDQSIGNNKINRILVTRKGSVWVTTEGGGVQLYDAQTRSFRRYPTGNSQALNMNALYEDTDGHIWLGEYFGLSRWHPADSQFVQQAPIGTGGQHLKAIAEDGDHRIWTGFQLGGLKYLDPSGQNLVAVSTEPAWREGHIRDLYYSPEQYLWVTTDDHLLVLEKTGSPDHYAMHYYGSTEDRRYLAICESTDGVIWIGTNNGAIVLTPRYKQFQHFSILRPGEPAAEQRGISAMVPEGDGQIWLGTNQGLFQFDIREQRGHQDFLDNHPLLARFDRSRIFALHRDRQHKLWLGIIDGFEERFGLYCYDLKAQKLDNLTERSELFASFATLAIDEDATGNLWFANHGGLIRYVPAEDTLQLFRHSLRQTEGLPNNRINALSFAGQDSLWIGTNEAGLSLLEPSNGRFTNQEVLFANARLQVNQRITTMLQDGHRLWLGTGGGLLAFDPTVPPLQVYDDRSGLLDNVIKTIQRADDGSIWLGTKTALARFDPRREQFTNFTVRDGLIVEEFWERAGFRDQDGRLYFGGDDGLQVFHPDSIRKNEFQPPVVFTRLLLSNREVMPDPDSKLLPAPLHQLPVITLQPDQNVISIHFAALSYINADQNQYAVMMDGFDADWQELGARTEATYTNLDPGTYFFRVRAANNDGEWNESGAALQLVVLAPWYRTWWAYFLYVLFLFSTLYLFYRFQLNRKLAEAEAHRLRELDMIKTQLYTNITHEFRTPLTLIQGPVEKALQDTSFSLGRVDLERIRQNCQRLLHLIRQMLHLNRLEAGGMTVDYQHGDVLPCIRYIVDAFSSFADSHQIRLTLDAPATPIPMDFDQEKLLDILSNLISNAVKFTPPGSAVQVVVRKSSRAGETSLETSISDNGPGIPEASLNKIFDRFYQAPRSGITKGEEAVSSGTGIGLALSRKLAVLMDGTITVSSTVGEGSTFSLHLPIRSNAASRNSTESPSALYLPQVMSTAGLPKPEAVKIASGSCILIVEDNADVARFVAESLPEDYQVQICPDGLAGVNWAVEHIPDLIISDVLMPELDGYELTGRLKNDHKTSHIPILLLTAKADLSSKITGFEQGADAYMAKPFNAEELLTRIENLLASRRRLQSHYLSQGGLQLMDPEDSETSPQENQFLQQVRALIEENLESGNYSIENLARDLLMSTAQLYRKMMALTGLSPSKFYRRIQIARAKELLGDLGRSINEVGYQTGFNDPAYFSRVFTAETGVNPSAYRDRIQ